MVADVKRAGVVVRRRIDGEDDDNGNGILSSDFGLSDPGFGLPPLPLNWFDCNRVRFNNRVARAGNWHLYNIDKLNKLKRLLLKISIYYELMIIFY